MIKQQLSNLGLYLFFTFFTVLSSAGEANFSRTFFDLQISIEGTDGRPVIERTYNSLVKQKGLFGVGWCSNLETTLFFSDDYIYFSECGFGEEEAFKRTKNRNIFTSVKTPLRKVHFEKDTYTLSDSGKTRFKFNYQGYIIQEQRATGEVLNFEYGENKLIKNIKLVPGGIISVSYNTGKIKVLTQLHDIQYVLKEGRLAEILENGKLSKKYNYNKSGTMLSYMENDQISVVQGKRMPAAIKKAESNVSKGSNGLIEEVNLNGKITKYFWNNDKIVKVIEEDPLLQKQKVLEFSYDNLGRSKQAIVTENNVIKLISYNYDETNQLSEIIIDQQKISVKRSKANLQLTKLISEKEQYNFLLPDSSQNSDNLLSLYEQALVILTKIEVAN